MTMIGAACCSYEVDVWMMCSCMLANLGCPAGSDARQVHCMMTVWMNGVTYGLEVASRSPSPWSWGTKQGYACVSVLAPALYSAQYVLVSLNAAADC
jgi:hypothetical protein